MKHRLIQSYNNHKNNNDTNKIVSVFTPSGNGKIRTLYVEKTTFDGYNKKYILYICIVILGILLNLFLHS